MKKQIVVMKGFEGFADRLQVLSHCIHYCKLHGAVLCVDWRDEMWGQGTFDFWDYFEIIGIPTISIEALALEIEGGASIEPASWTRELLLSPPTRNTLSENYSGPLNKITYEEVSGDIVVVSVGLHRMYHSNNLVENIRLKADVAAKIQARLSDFYLPCTVIHLRGTDRFDPTLIDQCLLKFNDLPLHCKARTYVISDMPDLIESWREKVPDSEILNKESSILSLPNAVKKGSHQYAEEILEFYGVSKFDLNLDTLIEFLGLCFASDAIGMEKSTYYSVARFISNEGVEAISAWMHGYKPQRKSLLKAAK